MNIKSFCLIKKCIECENNTEQTVDKNSFFRVNYHSLNLPTDFLHFSIDLFILLEDIHTIAMDPTNPELSSSSHSYGGRDNRSYEQHSNDVHSTTRNEDDSSTVRSVPRASSSSNALPGIAEIPTSTITTAVQPSSYTDLTNVNQRDRRKSSALGSNERQLSIIDPLSDRVSTILVWEDLAVQARPSKRKEFFQRLKSYKNFEPQRKFLLNKTSGAITGGLWAVMGKFSSEYHK